MTEFQKIATGLLGLTHPEIYTRNRADKGAPPEAARSSAVVRGLKFAFAALVAGSRAVPLGDNSQVTRELGAYGARLQERFN
ncbi:MAG: hypothetical protein QOK23_1526 [Gammaproteobacteria bacterium]|jgi:hypothetical protein|nr:hypothetical protein [Gammaproteobacteria bacterium]MEA3139357.1 hypothetical protein [Gammaproteobacteria bacterium]